MTHHLRNGERQEARETFRTGGKLSPRCISTSGEMRLKYSNDVLLVFRLTATSSKADSAV
jgi:hypothetical protein